MALFPRRVLQTLLDENSLFLRRLQTRRHVAELNRATSLSPQWEVALLNAVSRIGELSHERACGSRKPDIHLTSHSAAIPPLIADIVAVSDQGIRRRFPVDELEMAIVKRAASSRVRPNSLGIDIQGEYSKRGRRPKAILKIPGKARFEEQVLTPELDEFFEQVAAAPLERRSYQCLHRDVRLRIAYDPDQRFARGSRPSLTPVFSLKHNVIHNALSRKAIQLKDAEFDGVRGVLLCDGGCSAMGEQLRSRRSYSVAEVIQHFLCCNPGIEFVLTYRPRSKDCWENNVSRYEIQSETSLRQDSVLNPATVEWLASTIVGGLPEPEIDALTAMNRLRFCSEQKGWSHAGRWSVAAVDNAKTIRLSARAVLELLAGAVTQEEFFERHPELCKSQSKKGFFLRMLESGHLIGNVTLEKCESEDDDWLIISLVGPDPAVSAFREPSRS